MPIKRCPKYDHVATFEGQPPIACPACGAVYSKVEAAMQAGAPVRPARAVTGGLRFSDSQTSRSSAFQSELPLAAVEPFVDILRRESVYPTFRAVVRIGYWIVVGLAVLTVLISFFRGPVAIFGALTGSAVMVILVSFAREATLMLADLSDAAVRMAERQERVSD